MTLSKLPIFNQLLYKHVTHCLTAFEHQKMGSLLERIKSQINSRFTNLEINSLYAESTYCPGS